MKYFLSMALLAMSVGVVSAEDWRELTGDSSGIAGELAVAVQDETSWRDLWKTHARDGQALPAVDFPREMVVAVFLGARTQAGYTVSLDIRDAGQPAPLVVRYKEVAPAGGFNAQVVTHPYKMVKMPAGYASVSFERTDKGASATPAPNMTADLQSAVARIAKLTSPWTSAGTGDFAAPGEGVSGGLTSSPPAFATKELPPPPGQEPKKDKQLPPPPGQQPVKPKPLPPPPGEDDGGKPLPPPPGGGKPLPPPPGVRHPQPEYPGGPLSRWDDRLRQSERTWDYSGMTYIGFWNEGTYYHTREGRVTTSPTDRSNTFILNLESPKYQEYKMFYYNPANGAYYWRQAEELVRTKSRRIVIDYDNRPAKPLLPWERETFVFSFNGAVSDNAGVKIVSADAAYDYDVNYWSNPNDPLTLNVTMTATFKRRTSPDHNGADARIESDGQGGLTLAVTDRWASYYQGETLEIAYVVRQDDGSMWRRDPVVASADGRNPLRLNVPTSAAGGAITIKSSLGRKGSGKFYLESWSFRRSGSKVSTDGWVNKGKGNTITQ